MRPGSRATLPFFGAALPTIAGLLAAAGVAAPAALLALTAPLPAAAGPVAERTRTVATAERPPSSAAAGETAPVARGALTVTIDRAKVIRLPEGVQTVVLGNPSIADIAVQKNGLAILTGKSYGVTNVIALDATGNMLAESVVSVSAPNDSLVTVQRGLDRQSLSCTPSCQPSVVLGDAKGYFAETTGQADQHRVFSTQK